MNIDSPFTRAHGALHAERVSLETLAEHHGTPTYVYSASGIRTRYEALDAAFAALPHRICYAVKANSNLSILRLLAACGAGFDIVSGGELARVLQAGGDPAGIVFSGVGKRVDEMQAALAAGIGCFNVESAAELDALDATARRAGQRAPVALRVNPDVDPDTHPYIATGLAESKFGVGMDAALDLYQHANGLAGIKLTGVGAHIGSQVASIAPFLDSLDALLELHDQLGSRGIHLDHIDLGGGLGVRYHDEATPDINAYATAVAERIGSRQLLVELEPGRSIVANAGVLLTRVLYLKDNGARHFAVVDAGMNDLLRPSLYHAWHPVWPVRQRSDADLQHYDVVGPVCESGDYLALDRELAIQAGDLLAIGGAGAYGAVMASNYNSRPRPAEVLVDGDTELLVRRRETLADLYAAELVAGAPAG